MRKALAKSRQQSRLVQTKSMESPDLLITKTSNSPTPSKAKFTPKFDSKKKLKDSSAAMRSQSTQDIKPQILIKKSSTRKPQTSEADEEDEEEPSAVNKGGLLNQALQRQSIKDTDGLILPPLPGGRPSGLKQPTKTSKDQRPPLPQIKSNKSSTTSAGGGDHNNNPKGMSPHTSFNLISMNSQADSNDQSTGRQSYRSVGGHGGGGGAEILEKKKEQYKILLDK